MVLFGVSVVWTLPVSAQTSASVNIEVRGVIAPARSIVVDEQGSITQILSNTNENVSPVVYRLKIDSANQLPLTSDLARQYNQVLSRAGSKLIGVLYQRPANSAPLNLSTIAVQKILFTPASHRTLAFRAVRVPELV